VNRFENLRRKWLAASLERRSVEARRSLPARIAALPRWILAILGLIVLGILYWGVLGWILSDTSADLSVRPDASKLPPGGSVAVASAAMIMENAIEEGWTPNDSILRPTAMLDDMPAFQRGQHAVVFAFARALSASATDDPLLADAAEALSTPPDRGILHGDFPFVGGSAESRYGDAVAYLTEYNRALGSGEEVTPGPRRLRALLAAIYRSLSAEAISVDRLVDGRPDAGIDPAERYEEARGAAYAAALLMRGIREDFGTLIRGRQLGGAWEEATESLDAVATTDPFGIGRDDLVEQGYFLLRARDSLRAIAAGVGE
jgi:hypothetical protein